ncbi:MAG: aspartate dehydrogenase [Candidatus Omnitrophica bacterium]|nr:aspartate dehydrogenase [Candidatus Omnitrophota bacterium]MDD5737360.1 aspartate dehydrogenase [Candidatus Omnitrophota bacterium]
MVRIGIIGCGTIGSKIAGHIDGKLKGRASLVALSDINAQNASRLSGSLGSKPAVTDVDALIRASDLVIEAASAAFSGEVARKALSSGKDVMIMSTGGLLKDYKGIFALAEEKKARIYLPSGAICGLDGLKGAMSAGVAKVTLTTTKPPEGFKGAPYVVKNNIDLGKIDRETVLFEGDAYAAMEGFPANINVAATLSLCGIGPAKTKVRIVASPAAKRNIHELEAEGDFGKLSTKTENVPSPGNPKTSYMAILSAIATLEGIMGKVKIGT